MPRSKRRRHRNEPTPGWVWMLFGLGLGLLVALAVYLRAPRPRDAARAPVAAVTVPESAPIAAPAAAVDEPATPAPASTDPPADEARFSFYDLLPEFEVVPPETESAPRTDRSAGTRDAPGLYLIQVGSFRELADADRMQARLALLGIESRINRVTLGSDVFHRVEVGPIRELAELNRLQRRLRNERIDWLLREVAD